MIYSTALQFLLCPTRLWKGSRAFRHFRVGTVLFEIYHVASLLIVVVAPTLNMAPGIGNASFILVLPPRQGCTGNVLECALLHPNPKEETERPRDCLYHHPTIGIDGTSL